MSECHISDIFFVLTFGKQFDKKPAEINYNTK